MNIDKDYRYTRTLVRAYRAGLARQAVNPKPWREAGLARQAMEIMATREWWAACGKYGVYARAWQ